MHMTPHLKEIIKRLTDLSEHSTTQIHKDWVQVVMTLFRQHLEARNIKDQYPILMFYCNWNLHTNLDKGIVQKMLQEISIVITDETTGHPADRISEILALTRLRMEIIGVLNSHAGIRCRVFDLNDNWVAFTELMFPFLLNKPLKRTFSPQTHHWVESLELYDNAGKLFWQIRVSPGDSIFKGPLSRTK